MSELAPFAPENELERLIADAKVGLTPIADVLAQLVRGNVFVSSRREVQQNGDGFDPVLFDLPNLQRPLVAAFTAESRPALLSDVAKYFLQMPAVGFLARMPPGYGVILNPGYDAQLVIADHVVADLKSRIRPANDL